MLFYRTAYKGCHALIFLILLASAVAVRISLVKTDRPICAHKIGHVPFCAIFADFKSLASGFYALKLLHGSWRCHECGAGCFFDRARFVTELDPHFNFVYRFAWLVLTLNLRRPDLANELVKNGLSSEFNREDWRLHFYVACNEKFFLGVKDRAGSSLEHGPTFKSKNPLKADWPERPSVITA